MSSEMRSSWSSVLELDKSLSSLGVRRCVSVPGIVASADVEARPKAMNKVMNGLEERAGERKAISLTLSSGNAASSRPSK